MSLLLRIFLLDLVLADLVFVQITGQASTALLIPLFLLTLGSPLLSRFQDRFFYRSIWNGSIILVFLLLLRHLQQEGTGYLLQDGLLLAAFSQVHILNNIGSRQKPDLLFFNAFLIPLVTSFFTQDFSFILVFVLFVPLLLLSLQLYSLESSGLVLDTRNVARAVKGSLQRSALLLTLTWLIFVFLPRDFERKGWAGEKIEQMIGNASEVDFGGDIDLQDNGLAKLSSKIVNKAVLLDGSISEVPTYWGGSTFDRFYFGKWESQKLHATSPLADKGRLRDQGLLWTGSKSKRVWQRGEDPRGPTLLFRIKRWRRRYVKFLLPTGDLRVQLQPPTRPGELAALADGTLRILRSETSLASRQPITYKIRIGRPRTLGGLQGLDSGRNDVYRGSEDHGVPANLVALADRISESGPRRADQHVVVSHFAHFLSTNYRYLGPAEPGRAKSLMDFIAHRGDGHCEFFATALTLLLRHENIPCRLVSGYLTDEWDPDSKELTFRKRDAHSWVEVLDPLGGWYVVDTSPDGLASATIREDEENVWETLGAEARRFWDSLSSFDAEKRGETLQALWEFLGSMTRALWGRSPLEGPRPYVLGFFLLGLAWWIRRRRRLRSKTPIAVQRYFHELRKLRIPPPEPGQTPRDLLVLMQSRGLDPRILDQLAKATRRHERHRYGHRQEHGHQEAHDSCPSAASVRTVKIDPV